MLISIGQVAEIFGVCAQTIRNWCADGLLSFRLTKGGHRRFSLEEVNQLACIDVESEEKKTIIYSRVSSHDQKADRDRQTEELKKYCREHELENVEVIEDMGSGINYNKRGLRKLLKKVIMGKVSKIIVTYKDRLLRFGTEIISFICNLKGVELIAINSRPENNYYQDVTDDVLAILTVFASKIYGHRSHEKRAKEKKKATLST